MTEPDNVVVAFDILKAPVFDLFLLIPFGLAILGLLMVLGIIGGFRFKSAPAAGPILNWVYFLFALLIGGLGATSYFSEYAGLRRALQSGRANVVEGCLEAFHPMPESGHDTERLRLRGQTFAYSGFIVTPAFHKSEVYGGPIHRDSWVRITHVGGDIVRLEVADHACPAATADVPDDDEQM